MPNNTTTAGRTRRIWEARLSKAEAIVQYIYRQPDVTDSHESWLSRSQLIEYVREFQPVDETPEFRKFWDNLAKFADVRPPSQWTADLVTRLLQLIEDVDTS